MGPGAEMTVPLQFIDVQVNGYAGRDFNDLGLAPEDWHAACQRMREDGLSGVLATFVTGDIEAMAARLARLVEVRARDSLVHEMIWGVHIEGPFLSPRPGYVGAHPIEFIRPAHIGSMRRLLDAAGGLVRMVTLAPEHDAGLKVTRFLADQGIVVAAGHCDPDLDLLTAAIDAGLSMFTHLGNGCPMQLHRHDNIIQRVLSLADRLWISLIGDGAHIPLVALGNYIRCAGVNRVTITTDAMAAAGMPPGRYQLHDRTVEVDDRYAAWAPGRAHLVGGASTMPRIADLLRRELGLSDTALQAIMHDNAAKIIASAGPSGADAPFAARIQSTAAANAG
jgi:N-acetylglucosamine-6-phosphate deacetylase